jgi:signal transduction histidine kinase
MPFSKVFLMNISLLITLAYFMNLGYKYIIHRASYRVKYVSSVAMFLFAGWLTMVFALEPGESIRFDLRFLPLITAILVYTNPLTPLLIGVGIGLARYSFGISAAATGGFMNLAILGVVAAALNYWCRRSPSPFWRKVAVVILVVNVANILNISVFGVLPFRDYMVNIVPVTLPLGLALSCFFMFILRDFYVELRRTEELERTNQLLQRQAEALGQAKSALEEKANQLEQASQYKSEFLAKMSHELKTPLNSIILLSQLMMDRSGQAGQLSEEDLQYVQIIQSSSRELLQQINDILDLSKVEAGKMEIVKETVSLLEIPYILQHHFQAVAEQKGISFEIRIEDGLPDTLRTDGMRVHQILKNLLSNAFKFTKQGRIWLELYRVEGERTENGSTEWIAFSVNDTGIGIAEEKQQLIFEAFQQADGSINRQFGGTGLGLSISLELAKLLGGHLTVTSTLGEGSRFSLLLPMESGIEERDGEQDMFVKDEAVR